MTEFETASPGADRTEDLLAETRFARERYELYKARALGPRPWRLGRLRELERAWEFAQARLRSAQSRGRRL